MGATIVLCLFFFLVSSRGNTQADGVDAKVNVRLRIEFPHQGKPHSFPAVMWLTPLLHSAAVHFTAHGPYTLLQKNRTFVPHILVVPVGTAVSFPNADPFFHNVFSLFDGKRFDLGLYEAGSAKQVTFSREGVSYIFCNIHPEMSAVVVALSTPFNGIADEDGEFQLSAVPVGEYELHLWIEGEPPSELDKFSRKIKLTSRTGDLGTVDVQAVPRLPASHLNEFGKPYGESLKTSY